MPLSPQQLVIASTLLTALVVVPRAVQAADTTEFGLITQCQANFFTINNLFDDGLDEEACLLYQRKLSVANQANDATLCPDLATVKQCVLALEPRIILEYTDCTQNDQVPGEVCFTKERAAAEADRVLRQKLNLLGEVCVDALVMEAVQLELIAYEVMGCTSYVDVQLSPAEVATNIALHTQGRSPRSNTAQYNPCPSQPPTEGTPNAAPPDIYNFNFPPIAPQPKPSLTTEAPISISEQLDETLAPGIAFFDTSRRYDPYEDPCYDSPTPAREGFLYGDPQKLDLIETCTLVMVRNLGKENRQYLKYPACRKYLDKQYNAFFYDDESRCPSIELVEECYESFGEFLISEYEGCALKDDIPGTKCLSLDKWNSLILRIFPEELEKGGAACVDASVYEFRLARLAIMKVAGCTEYTNDIAGGPSSITALGY